MGLEEDLLGRKIDEKDDFPKYKQKDPLGLDKGPAPTIKMGNAASSTAQGSS